MTPRVISLFSGVGTFDYGFHLAGWKTVFLCEWDAKAREVLNVRFPEVPISPDVRGVRGAELPDAECIMFGSPCQDISVAGKRSGMTEGSDTRSSLFFEAIRIIREKQEATGGKFPRFALWENVPGAFSSNGGRDFAAVLAAMVGGTVHVPAGGWRNAGVVFGPHGQGAWRVLDSQFFRVPQRRRRIFLVADFGGERAGQILLESEGVRGHPQPRRKAREETAVCAGSGAQGDGWRPAVAPTLDAQYGRKWGSNQHFFSQGGGHYVPDTPSYALAVRGREGGSNLEIQQEIGYALRAGDGGSSRSQLIAQPLPFDTTQVTSAANGSNPRPGDPCHPLTAAGHAPAIAFDYKASVQRDPMCGPISPTLEAQDKSAVTTAYGVRRLTPTECERLQSMPDGWTDVNGMADSHRYRFMGNGGTARKLKWIATRMKEAL